MASASAVGLALAACSQGSEIISPGLTEVTRDTIRPAVSFSPAVITVNSASTGVSTLTATDNVGVTGGPDVTCTRGSFAGNTYTAPAVSVNTDIVCTATATDAAGNAGSATLTVSIIAPDETAPVVSFNPVSLTLPSGDTGMSQVSATDAVDGAVTPTVSCTNGGSYNVGTGVFTAPTVPDSTTSVCTATATDSEGNSGSGTLTVNITSATAASCPGDGAGSALGEQTLCSVPLGNLSEFRGVLTQSATIPFVEGVVYELSGRLDVGRDGGSTCADVTPVVLTIEPGVTIAGDAGSDYLVVNRCHRIEASGTREAPIMFTSRNDIAGAGARENAIGEWGGVVILGNAPINRCNVPGRTGGTTGCENIIEGVTEPDALYGGADGNSNSGTLRYVTVRHAGNEVATDVELNGITFGGVGDGTTVAYIQVHNSSDDGMEFFGGTVDARYVVLTGNDDEQLDTDSGYQGSIQYVIGLQRGGDTSDNSIEASSVAPGVTPASDATIANFTLIGAGNTDSHGIRVNSGTIGTYLNGVLTDGNACLDYEDDAGDGIEGFTAGSDPAFRSVLFDCAGGVLTTDTDDDADPVTGQAAVDADANNVTDVDNTLDGFVNGTVEAAVIAAAVPQGNTFLESVDYIGAVRDASDTWWQGWTCGLETSDPC